LDKWAVGTGYTAPDYQVGLILGDKGKDSMLLLVTVFDICVF